MTLSNRTFTLLLLVIPAAIVCLLVMWRGRWTKGRGFAVGAAFGIWSTLLLQIMCVAGVAGMPGIQVANHVGLRGSCWWFPVAAVVNASFWGVLTELVLQRNSKKRRSGFCAICGYDLTGNVSGVCPECGTPTGPEDQPNGR